LLVGSWRKENQIEIFDIRNIGTDNISKTRLGGVSLIPGPTDDQFIYAAKFVDNGKSFGSVI